VADCDQDAPMRLFCNRVSCGLKEYADKRGLNAKVAEKGNAATSKAFETHRADQKQK
jgi:hypothetical protein